MKKSRQEKLLSYSEYRLREGLAEEEELAEGDDWSFEEPQPVGHEPITGEGEQYAPSGSGQEWNWEGGQEGQDQSQADLQTLGMDAPPTFAQMPAQGNEMAASAGPGPDEDPEDWQAKQDIEEVAGVYGLKLGSTKSGKLVVQGGKLSPWRQDFGDYVSAKKWIEANMDKVSRA